MITTEQLQNARQLIKAKNYELAYILLGGDDMLRDVLAYKQMFTWDNNPFAWNIKPAPKRIRSQVYKLLKLCVKLEAEKSGFGLKG